MNTLELAYKAGLNDYFKVGKKYGNKCNPPPWMNKKERRQYYEGKNYAKDLSYIEGRETWT